MNKDDYAGTNDYKESVTILNDFVKDVLDGDIYNLRDLDFLDLTTYVGDIADPDMYLITQAVYIILWGDIYDLTFDKMGSWNLKNDYAYRGDTLNSFGSLFGKPDRKGKTFAFRAKKYGADENSKLWIKIEEFYKLYHTIGNFLIIPNRGTVKNGINGARGLYYDNDSICEGMRDYFDWFLLAVAEYQAKVKRENIHFSKFEKQLQMNPEFDPAFMPIEKWEEIFFLKPYFRDGKPILIFKTPLKDRLKITDPNGTDPEKFYCKKEYLDLLEDYIDKTEEVIRYRSDRMIEALNRILLTNNV